MKKGDLAIIVSYSGETVEMVLVLREARKNGNLILSLTKHGQNSIADMMYTVLIARNQETSVRMFQRTSV